MNAQSTPFHQVVKTPVLRVLKNKFQISVPMSANFVHSAKVMTLHQVVVLIAVLDGFQKMVSVQVRGLKNKILTDQNLNHKRFLCSI